MVFKNIMEYTKYLIAPALQQAGEVILKADVPEGQMEYYLPADFGLYLIADEPELFSKIGLKHNLPEDDGSLYFRVPDYRGVVPRGLDLGRGLDEEPNREVGSFQANQNKEHDHPASSDTKGHHGHTASVAAGGNHSHGMKSSDRGSFSKWTGNGGRMVDGAGGISQYYRNTSYTYAGGSHAHGASVAANGNHNHGITVQKDGGAENRMDNVATYYVIRRKAI